MADNKIEIDVDLAIKQALKGIDELNQKFEGFAKAAEANSGKASSAWNTFTGTLSASGVEKFLENTFKAAEKLFDVFVIQGIEAASKQEEALNAMNIALATAGQYSETASGGMEEFANSLERTTKFSDDQILKNAALIESMGHLTGDGLKKATQAAIELAATYQIDLDTASRMIGKATEGNVASFQKLGIHIEKSADNATTFSNVLKVLSQNQGTAEAQAKTFAGAQAILGNSFEDMQKQTGKIVTQSPVVIAGMNLLSKAFQDVADYVADNKEALQAFVKDGVLLALDVIVIFARALDSVGGILNSFFHLLLDDVKSGVYLLNAMGLASDDTLAKVNKVANALGSVDISQILHQAEGQIEGFTKKYKEAIAEQNDADDERTGKLQANSDQHAKILAAELEKKKHMEFTALFETKKFEDRTSQEKIDGVKSSFGTISGLMKSHNLELFRIGQAAAIANATIDGIKAVVSALSSFSYPYNIVVAAIVGAAVAAQIADIASTPAPSFAEGGIVPGSSFTGDKIQANVNSGEMILTMTDQANLLRQIRDGQGGRGHTVIIQGNVYADDDSQVDRLMERIKDRLEFGNGSLTPVIS